MQHQWDSSVDLGGCSLARFPYQTYQMIEVCGVGVPKMLLIIEPINHKGGCPFEILPPDFVALSTMFLELHQ